MTIIISLADIGLYLKRIKKYYEICLFGVDKKFGITVGNYYWDYFILTSITRTGPNKPDGNKGESAL